MTNHTAQLQASHPHAQPPPQEVADMTWRADTVMRLLEEVRRLSLPEGIASRENPPPTSAPSAPEDHARPPKRPWEDMAREEPAAPAASTSYPDVSHYR